MSFPGKAVQIEDSLHKDEEQVALLGTTNRIHSIDWLRGLVLAIMVLDHSRHFFLKASISDIEHLTPLLFFTRFITHFCAPTFVLLAGISARLVCNRKGMAATSRYLFTRGIFLIFLELTLVRFGFGYYFRYNWFVLQVIFVIGVSMMLLSGVMYFKNGLILLVSLVLIVGHNVLDGLEPGRHSIWVQNIWILLHKGGTIEYLPGWSAFVSYPLIPWPAVMFLGYVLGGLYDLEHKRRMRYFIFAGAGCLVMFVILRSLNVYGDPNPWQAQDRFSATVMSFLMCEKYPPSLQFLCLTMSLPLILLGLLDACEFTKSRLLFFGKNSLFFYVAHLYLLSLPARFWSGLIGQEMSNIQLAKVYAIWVIVLVAMYWLCKEYNQLRGILKHHFSEKRQMIM
jgi:uncharacterized membrane protein